MDKKQGYGAGTILASILFVVWFAASLAGMIYCSKTGRGLLVPALLGQYFFVFGMVGIVSTVKSETFQPFLLIFPILGILLIAIPIWLYFGGEKAGAMLDVVLPYVVVVTILIGSILLLILSQVNTGRKKKQCTMTVNAMCVALDARYHKGTRTVCPTYEFYYAGESHRVCDYTYTSQTISEGDACTLLIDPEKPDVFYDEKREERSRRVTTLIGVMGILCGALGLYMMLFGNQQSR